MWRYKDLLINLTLVEFKNRYQNTFLGFFWAILSPLAFAGVLYFVFRHLWGAEANFFLNIMVGIMAWRFFINGSAMCMNSIVSKPNLITKIYIPRHILVITTAIASVISAFLEFIILIIIVFIIAGKIPLTVLFVPVMHILFAGIVLGLGFLLSAFFVYFRDLSQIWEVATNVFFFAIPIFYPLSVVPDYLLPYYLANPITRIILMYRDIIIDGIFPSLDSFVLVIGTAILLLVIGWYVFNGMQKRFAEVI